MLAGFLRLISGRSASRDVSRHSVRGIAVVVDNTRPDIDTADVLARLDRLGFPLEMDDRARQERFCRRAEIEFGRLVPNGERVVERAQWSSDLSDEDVAPMIDPILAAQRIAEVDREALEKRTT